MPRHTKQGRMHRRNLATASAVPTDAVAMTQRRNPGVSKAPGFAVVVVYCSTSTRSVYFDREDHRAAAAFLAMARRFFGSRFAALVLPPIAPRLRRAAVAAESAAGLESFTFSPTAIATMKLASSFVSRGRLGFAGIPQKCHRSGSASSGSTRAAIPN